MKKRYARWQLVVLGILRFLVATLSMSIACYIVFALVFSTEEERRLMKENSLYKSRYKQMQQKQMLIGDVVEGLQDKDDAIYRELFETEAPSLDALTATDLIAQNDSLSESFYQTAAASAPGGTTYSLARRRRACRTAGYTLTASPRGHRTRFRSSRVLASLSYGKCIRRLHTGAQMRLQSKSMAG